MKFYYRVVGKAKPKMWNKPTAEQNGGYRAGKICNSLKFFPYKYEDLIQFLTHVNEKLLLTSELGKQSQVNFLCSLLNKQVSDKRPSEKKKSQMIHNQ